MIKLQHFALIRFILLDYYLSLLFDRSSLRRFCRRQMSEGSLNKKKIKIFTKHCELEQMRVRPTLKLSKVNVISLPSI